MAFDFGTSSVFTDVRRRLEDYLGPAAPIPVRTPVGQLVKSLISNRTYDAVSLRAFEALIAALSWSEIAAAPTGQIEALIGEVEFADRKASHLKDTLRLVEARHPDFDLGALGSLSEPDALNWLERLPGVGRKVAASVLNFSTLQRRAFVIDTHVLRILHRLGIVGPGALTPTGYDGVMAALAGWSARELTDLHVQMKRLGQEVCRPQRPCCAICPLAENCRRPLQAGGSPSPA